MEHFVCVVFLADGKTISQYEVCDTAAEAVERAAKWRAVGGKAQAYRNALNLDTLKVHSFPLN